MDSTVRAFVNTYPVAFGKDESFKQGRAGLMAREGRVVAESLQILAPKGLEEIGGENIQLFRNLSAHSHEAATDNWSPF